MLLFKSSKTVTYLWKVCQLACKTYRWQEMQTRKSYVLIKSRMLRKLMEIKAVFSLKKRCNLLRHRDK